MAVIVGHSQVKYLDNFFECPVFSYSGFTSRQFLDESLEFYELLPKKSYSDDGRDIFIQELADVDSLYFNEAHSYNSDLDLHNEFQEIFDPESDEESPSKTIYNDESDAEIEVEDLAPHISTPTDHERELSAEDLHDEQQTSSFFNDTCGCTLLYGGTPCCSVVERASVASLRASCSELESSELDLVVKASLLPHRDYSTQTQRRKDRQRPRQRYFVQGKETCRKVFCFSHGIGVKQFRNITQSLDKDGLVPRCHGNSRRLPHNALTFFDRNAIKQFIVRYANKNAVPLPGRLPNYRDSKVLLLPSDQTKADIYDMYVTHDMEFRVIGRSCFYKTWHELCPTIVLSKPATDLCQKCQTWTTQIAQSGNCSEEEKDAVLESYKDHVGKAKLQRDLYREQTHQAQITCGSSPVVEGADPCSLKDGPVHYSWDFAQQVHVPHHSQQVGPIYFKTPRKCEVFGVCCEGTEKQVFYLANEGEAPGKGANTVLSYVHHYLEHYGLGEEHAQIHFDNCCGQNKNNTVLAYAMWRVMTGRHLVIEYNLMMAGHTKFSPDWHFGLWKSRWRHVDAETVQDVAVTIQQSSRNGHNVPHRVSETNSPVTFYDWTSFFKRFFKPLKNITKYHSFCVSSTEPGVVACKLFDNSAEEKFCLLKPAVDLGGLMPDECEGKGLDPERQWYLFDQIRQFCRSESSKEQVCPEPSCTKLTYKKRKVQGSSIEKDEMVD